MVTLLLLVPVSVLVPVLVLPPVPVPLVPVPLVPVPVFDPLTLIRTVWLAGMLIELTVAALLEAVVSVEVVVVLVDFFVVIDWCVRQSPVEDEGELDEEDEDEDDELDEEDDDELDEDEEDEDEEETNG